MHKGDTQRKIGSSLQQGFSKSKSRQSLADTLSKLRGLIESEPAAEELSSNWSSFKPLATALDGAAKAPVGVPLLIAIRTLKAKWHADETWPLLGSDQQVPSDSPLAGFPRSRYATELLLRPPSSSESIFPPGSALPPEEGKGDPDCDDIAKAYERRGVFTEEARQGNFDTG